MGEITLSLLGCFFLFIANLQSWVQFETELRQAPIGDNLVYYSGPVVTNIKVVDVLWGPHVNPQIKEAMPAFLNAIIQSSWIDGLSHYNTAGKHLPSTNQLIGRGTFLGQFQIDPVHKSVLLTEGQIQNELVAQLNAGILPAPEYDDSGNLETIYMIEFPPDMLITARDGSISCVHFCALHGTMLYNDKPIMYSIHPDLSFGGCSLGCGRGTILQNQESAHSHALAEAITNPEGNAENSLSWYNPNHGEVADYCNQLTSQIMVDGQTYTVHNLWSNVRGRCVSLLPSIPPPQNFVAQVIVTPGGIVHELSWDPSPTPYLNGYRLIEDGTILGVIPKEGPYTFSVPDRNPSQTYVYRLVAFNDSGIQSTFEVVSVL